jgi:hypothetical protein
MAGSGDEVQRRSAALEIYGKGDVFVRDQPPCVTEREAAESQNDFMTMPPSRTYS